MAAIGITPSTIELKCAKSFRDARYRANMSQHGPRSLLFDSPRHPTPPGSSSKAPSGSAEERRKHLRESEDSSGEMSLESFLYRTDPYRSSSLKPPLPVPTRLHSPKSLSDSPKTSTLLVPSNIFLSTSYLALSNPSALFIIPGINSLPIFSSSFDNLYLIKWKVKYMRFMPR